MWKIRKQARSTDILYNTKCQHETIQEGKESKQVTAAHPGEHRGRDKSGYEKEVMDKEHSLPGEQRGIDGLRHGKEANERGMLTSWSTDRD
jgi:hypothetical protein